MNDETLEEKLRKMKVKCESQEEIRKKIKELQQQLDEFNGKVVDTNYDNQVYDKLIAIYKNCEPSKFYYKMEDYFKKKLAHIKRIDQHQIQKVAGYIDNKLFLEKDEEEFNKSGIFLTKLIEICDSNTIVLKLKAGLNIHNFGYNLKRNAKISLQGDIGSYLGFHMKTGFISVEGNVCGICGNVLQGGTIHIKNEVYESCGFDMYSGKIIVEGDVHGNCAEDMKGGTINVKGNVDGNLAYCLSGGKIIIEGDVHGTCGNSMSQGLVEVHGNIYSDIADWMHGGTIKVFGDQKPSLAKQEYYDSYYNPYYESTIEAGIIYHKNKIIFSR